MTFIARITVGWYPWYDYKPITMNLSKYTDSHFCSIARFLDCVMYHAYERYRAGVNDFEPDSRYGRDVYILCQDKVSSLKKFVALAKAIEAHADYYECLFQVPVTVELLEDFPDNQSFGEPVFYPENQ